MALVVGDQLGGDPWSFATIATVVMVKAGPPATYVMTNNLVTVEMLQADVSDLNKVVISIMPGGPGGVPAPGYLTNPFVKGLVFGERVGVKGFWGFNVSGHVWAWATNGFGGTGVLLNLDNNPGVIFFPDEFSVGPT